MYCGTLYTAFHTGCCNYEAARPHLKDVHDRSVSDEEIEPYIEEL